MVEAPLTSTEIIAAIIAASKKWQAKISTGGDVSMRDLFDLTRDVVRIRVTVGLTSSVGRGESAILPYEGTNMRLIAGLDGPNEQSVDIIMALPEDNNPQGLTEVYHLAKKPDSLADLDSRISPSRAIVSMIHRVSFRSLLVPGRRDIVQEQMTYEDSPLSFGDRALMATMARAIWSSHLVNDAPLQAEYLSPETTVATP